MIVTKLSVDGVSADQLSYVLDVLKDTQGNTVLVTTQGAPDLTPEQRDQIAALHSDTDPLDDIYTGPMDDLARSTNGDAASSQGTGRVTDHLEVVDLDDDDALARIAFDAFAVVTGQTHTFDDDVYKDGWRAAAAAVRTATLLQQANRAAADT
jgi:hypothetical protein